MKKTLRVLVLAVAMLMLATLIVGCKPATQATTYTVTFDADGGAPVPAAQKVTSGEKATKPTEPTKTDFTFAGWYLGDKEYTFQEAVTSDITLKAKWTPVSTKPETATTEEVTYTTTIRGGDVTIKVALEYEKQSHKIVDVLLADDNVYCTSNWTDKWQAGEETVVASYVDMTLEEVVALEAATGDGVVTGATLSSNALLEAVKMAAGTVVTIPAQTATTEEVTYTTTIKGGDVTIKVALKYETESHKITEVILADDNVYCTSNWTDKWQAGAETAVASYVGMTLEEVAALEAATGNGVVTGATLSSNALLEAVKMAALTVVPAPAETATTEEITYSTTIMGQSVTYVLSVKYEVESHKIVDVIFGEGCKFTTGGNFEQTWQAGLETAKKAYTGLTLEQVIALDQPTGNQVVTGTTLSSKSLLAAIQMAAGTVGGEDGTWTINSATGELTGYNGTDSEVVIPATVGDIAVVKLGDGLFADNTTVTKVTVPASVTEISAGAFTGATNLTEVVFEQGGTNYVKIDGSFKGLAKLKTVILPAKSNLMTSAFEGCTSLATVTNLEGALVIQNRAFFGCTSLNEATISATMVGESAFEGCTALQTVTVNAGSFMTMSGKYIFKGCTALQTFEIPKPVTSISTTSFDGCENLTLTVAEGNTKYFAADGVLYSGNELVYVPAGVAQFQLPATVTNIGSMQTAFADAAKITAINVSADNTSFASDNGVLYTADYTQILFVPSAIGPTFEIRKETTSAGVMAFAYSTGIENITVNAENTKFKVMDSILYFERGTNSYYLVTVADRNAQKEVTVLDGNAQYTLSSVMAGAFDYGNLTGIVFRNANHIGTGWASVEIASTMSIKATEPCANKINSNMSAYKDRVEYIPSFVIEATEDAAANGQALADAVANAQYGDVIALEEGTYLTHALTISKALKIEGAGADKTIVQAAGSYVKFIDVANVDFTLTGVYVKGPETASHNNHRAVTVGTKSASNTVVIANCKFTGFTKNSIDIKGGNATVTGNEIVCEAFDGATGNGIVIDEGAKAVIKNNNITGYVTYNESWEATGILVLRNGKITEVSDNVIKNCQNGICMERYYDYATPGDYSSECLYTETSLDANAETANTFEGCTTNVLRRDTTVSE